jgi:hypothetical protein
VRFGADSTFRSLSSGLKVPIGVGGPSLQPMMWMFIAILATFLIVVSATPHGAALDVAAALFEIGVSLMLSVICLLKGKVTTGVIGTVIGVVAFVGAVRLAKPGSLVGDPPLRQSAPASGTRRASLRPAVPAALESVARSRSGRPLPGPPALGGIGRRGTSTCPLP